jgi:hypothetical protein
VLTVLRLIRDGVSLSSGGETRVLCRNREIKTRIRSKNAATITHAQ